MGGSEEGQGPPSLLWVSLGSEEALEIPQKCPISSNTLGSLPKLSLWRFFLLLPHPSPTSQRLLKTMGGYEKVPLTFLEIGGGISVSGKLGCLGVVIPYMPTQRQQIS